MSTRTFARFVAFAVLAGVCAFGEFPSAQGAIADENDVLLWSRGTTTLTDLDLLVRPAGWQVVNVMRYYPVARQKTFWRLKRLNTTTAMTRDALISWLKYKAQVRLIEKNVRYRLAVSYRGDQSDIPIFDDELALSSMYGQPAVTQVGAAAAHMVAMGAGIRIAVLDGGFELSHEALMGRTILGYDALQDDYDPNDRGNFVDDDGDGIVDKGIGHGTAVAGVIAAVAPASMIIPVRVLDDEGYGTAQSITLGIYYALDMGAQIINISASGTSWSWIVENALRECSQRGVLVVGTPGNGGYNTVNYPGSSDYVVPVAGITPYLTVDPYSNYGAPIELSAPSVDIIAPHKQAPNAYARWPGTSFAAPFYAGAAALVLEKNPGATATLAGQLILGDLQPYSSLPPGYLDQYGGGMLDVDDVILPPPPEPLPPPPPPPAPFVRGQPAPLPTRL